MVTSLAWSMGGKVNYVLEGNLNYTGAVITWLKDDLKLIESPGETGTLAREAIQDDELYLIPAFSGLGAPYWDSRATVSYTHLIRRNGKMKGFKKVLAVLLTVAMVGAMAVGCGSKGDDKKAEDKKTEDKADDKKDDKVLKGGGSNIMYIITPSVSNPAFKAEVDTASAKAEELGYEVKAVSHDDDPTKPVSYTHLPEWTGGDCVCRGEGSSRRWRYGSGEGSEEGH